MKSVLKVGFGEDDETCAALWLDRSLGITLNPVVHRVHGAGCVTPADL